MNKVLNKLNRKFGRYYISNLMLYIVIGTGIVFAFWYLFPDLPLLRYLTFDRSAILHGQVWRLISFIFIPENSNPISMLFWLYMYWFIGSSLEQQWGSFNFNVYYFSGVIFSLIGGFITDYATVHYLNLSLFLAMGAVCPNMKVLLFFFIPIKMKWLALADGVLLIISFFMTNLGGKVVILLSLLNFILFFGGDFYRFIRDKIRYRKIRQTYKNNSSDRK